VREEEYISAAVISGIPPWRIMIRHVLPRIVNTVIVQAALFSALALTGETGLAYLGFSVAPPGPSWGGLVADAANVVTRDSWLLVPGGTMIALTVLALVLLGNALRDVTTEAWSNGGSPERARARREEPVAVEADRTTANPDQDMLLTVSGLSVEFRGDTGVASVISDVSFTIGRGETVAILGESGCGKSVTASAILGVLARGARRTAGHCWLGSTELTDAQLSKVRGRRIGFVAQDPMAALDPTFTVGFQVAEAVRRHDRKLRARDAKLRAVQLLGDVRLNNPAEMARRYPHQLSGGMAQRVAIAVALAGDPELLIADEPTTALDVTVQAEVLRLLRQLQDERSMAIMLVTHDWGVVAAMAHRVVVLYAGEVVEQALVRELYDDPQHPYTRALLDANPDRATPGAELPAIRGAVPPPGLWPEGCRFQPRCPLATTGCENRIDLTKTNDAREVRCIRAGDREAEALR
jgi:peptide/nickel transport system permease protein